LQKEGAYVARGVEQIRIAAIFMAALHRLVEIAVSSDFIMASVLSYWAWKMPWGQI
jgi:hypothetical protein